MHCPSLDIEWLLSTLFDASLLSTSSRRQRRLLFLCRFGRLSAVIGPLTTPVNYVADCRRAVWTSGPAARMICSIVYGGAVEACGVQCVRRNYVRESFAERSAAGLVRRAAHQVRRPSPTCSATAWLWSRRPRPISTAPAGTESKELERAAALDLRHREHAADHAADAARLLAAAASRGQGRRDVARPGQQGKDQGQALGRRSRTIRTIIELLPETLHDLIERSHGAAEQGAPARRHHPCRTAPDARADRQSGGAAARPAEGGVRARTNI